MSIIHKELRGLAAQYEQRASDKNRQAKELRAEADSAENEAIEFLAKAAEYRKAAELMYPAGATVAPDEKSRKVHAVVERTGCSPRTAALALDNLNGDVEQVVMRLAPATDLPA